MEDDDDEKTIHKDHIKSKIRSEFFKEMHEYHNTLDDSVFQVKSTELDINNNNFNNTDYEEEI